jgi:hypothetical protein
VANCWLASGGGRSAYTFSFLSVALAGRAASSLGNTPGSELNYRGARPRVGSQVLELSRTREGQPGGEPGRTLGGA